MKIIDFHCDTILALMDDKNNSTLRKNNLSIDIEKMNKGDYMAQFFAMFVYLQKNQDPLEMCLEMIDRFYCELESNKEDINLAKNYDEMVSNQNEGKMSAFLAVEEGGVLKGKIHNLRNLYRLGVRLITLTWNFPNEIGFPNCQVECMDKGLTPFGEEVVSEMNKLGMIIDVSHLSDKGFYDVANLSQTPFIASHSNARIVKNHTRNLTDDMIKTLAEKGGVTGINFAREFLGEWEISRVQDIIAHIKHIKNVGGIDVISLGTDYDGISPYLEIQNAGEMDKLITGLNREGFTEDEIDKILNKNAMRVIRDVL